jgi:predicted HTH domain antitoxin
MRVDRYVNVTVPVPEGILLSLRVEGDEFASQLRVLAAMKLYEQQKLSLGQSAAFAGMDKLSFIKFLGQNKISVFGPASEIEEDCKNALSWSL